jgi:hypothetical protein
MGNIIMSVISLHDSRKEGAAGTIKRLRMLKGVVTIVKVSIMEYEGVKSTEGSAIVVGGGEGVVVSVDDEELQKAYDLEVDVGPEGGGDVGKCGIREKVDEATAAAAFEVWNDGFERMGDKYGGVIGVYGDHTT